MTYFFKEQGEELLLNINPAVLLGNKNISKIKILERKKK